MTDVAKQSALFNVIRNAGAQFIALDGWQVPAIFTTVEAEVAAGREHVGVADCCANSKVLIEGETAASFVQNYWNLLAPAVGEGDVANAAAVGAAFGGYIFRLRPDQFFLSAPPGDETSARLAQSGLTSAIAGRLAITDMTHGRSELWLVGPASAELLSRLCGLNFGDEQFPNLAARQSSVAKTHQLILRRDLAGLRAYALIGDRSLAGYLWETTLEAGQNLGIRPIGWTALSQLAHAPAGGAVGD